MRFPRTIRLDSSDPHVFAVAAEPGELAVSGAFAFANLDEDALTGKTRQAFANGFLGTESFGRSTLVAVAEIDEAEYERTVEALAAHFVSHYGAPDMEAALPVARDEADYAAGLCDHPTNMLLTVSRSLTPEGIVERFGTLELPPGGQTARIWEITGDDGDGAV